MLIAYKMAKSWFYILLTLHCYKYPTITAIVKNSSLIKQSATKLKSLTLCDWIFEPLFKFPFYFGHNIVTLYKKIRKSQEIIGNQDSANPWILSDFKRVETSYTMHFFMLQIPRALSKNRQVNKPYLFFLSTN